MKLEMKGRGIPKELKVGPVGYNDRKDPLREKAMKMMKGDLKQVSKPFSPESASSPGNSKLARGYRAGGHVKTASRIATNMHLPREIDGHMPKKTPQTRVKKAGGVMQGDCGPGPSKREREFASQAESGPALKKGGMLHKALGGLFNRKQAAHAVKSAVKPIAKEAYKDVIKPAGKELYKDTKFVAKKAANKTMNHMKDVAGAAVGTGVTTLTGNPALGIAAGMATRKGTGSLMRYGQKKAEKYADKKMGKAENYADKKLGVAHKKGGSIEGCLKKKR